MSQPDSTAPGATLGEKNLSTLHAVAQSPSSVDSAGEHHGVPAMDETLDYRPAR